MCHLGGFGSSWERQQLDAAAGGDGYGWRSSWGGDDGWGAAARAAATAGQQLDAAVGGAKATAGAAVGAQ